MKQQIRVLLVTDQRLFAESISALLGTEENVDVVGSVTDLQEFHEAIRSLSIDIVLIDANLEIAKPASLIRLLKTEIPGLKIIALGIEHSDESILKLIEAGVDGYTCKETCLDELLRRIEDVHNGLTSCSPHIAAMALSRINELSQERTILARNREATLTSREREVLELVSMGLSNKEIAQRPNVSPYTVKNHVHSILEKLQVRYRREAILLVHKRGLLKQHAPYRLSAQER